MGIGEERKADLTILGALVFEDESVGNCSKHLSALVFIIFYALRPLCPLPWILHQLFHSGFVGGPLLRCQRLSIDQKRAGELPIFCINYVAVLSSLFIFAMDAIAPVGMVSSIRFHLVLNRVFDVLIRVGWERREGPRLGLQSEGQTCRHQEHRRAPWGVKETHNVIKSGIYIDAGTPAASCILHFGEVPGDLEVK